MTVDAHPRIRRRMRSRLTWNNAVLLESAIFFQAQDIIFDWFQIRVVYSNIFWQSNMEVGHKTNNHCLITGGFFSPFVVESLNIPTFYGGFSALKITSLRSISSFSKPFFPMDLGHRIPFHSRGKNRVQVGHGAIQFHCALSISHANVNGIIDAHLGASSQVGQTTCLLMLELIITYNIIVGFDPSHNIINIIRADD